MKNLFKIHPLTYIILLSILLTGYFNYFLIISFILIIHDLGHIIFLKIYKYKIYSITILPFGSIINSSVNSNSKTIEILIISLAGVCMQGLLYPCFFLLSRYYISDLSYNIFLNYNKYILLFNLLPIIPLDGSKVILSLLENIISYKKALIILNYISIFIIIIFFFYLTYQGLNSYLIVIFLIYKTFEEIKNHKYIFNQFLLTRYLSKVRYYKVKYIKKMKNIFKNNYNFINNQNEEKVLKTHYNNSICKIFKNR
ncbi:MAG: hypothetical protein PHG03_03630 [Bacilli bacterium]|nr:hypothetical protein [Bacilli bacterium]MDD4795631.1 hypothetical protein [Bacilli bacterium]